MTRQKLMTPAQYRTHTDLIKAEEAYLKSFGWFPDPSGLWVNATGGVRTDRFGAIKHQRLLVGSG
jgi:hypothetical protein